jgi:hypothetical protein
MRKLIGILVVCAMVLSVSAIVDAKKGGGNGKEKVHKEQVKKENGSKTTPHGWSQGKKTGWQGSSYPPGWSKWDKKKQETWTADRNESEHEINTWLIRYKIEEAKRTEILSAYDQAIVGGLAINDARKTMVSALKDEKTRRGLMIDTTKSVLDLLR